MYGPRANVIAGHLKKIVDLCYYPLLNAGLLRKTDFCTVACAGCLMVRSIGTVHAKWRTPPLSDPQERQGVWPASIFVERPVGPRTPFDQCPFSTKARRSHRLSGEGLKTSNSGHPLGQPGPTTTSVVRTGGAVPAVRTDRSASRRDARQDRAVRPLDRSRRTGCRVPGTLSGP